MGILSIKLIRIKEMKICMLFWYFYGLISKWLLKIYLLFSIISIKIWYGIFLLFNKFKLYCIVFIGIMYVKIGKNFIEVFYF